MSPRADFFRSSRLFRAGRVCIVLWIAAWVGYGILYSIRANGSLRDSVGVLACVLFGLALIFHVAADRRAWRELRARAAREDVSAARSRGDSRVASVHK